MKTLISFFVFWIFSNITTTRWFWQNPLPKVLDLGGVFFISQTVGWSVGFSFYIQTVMIKIRNIAGDEIILSSLKEIVVIF